MEGKWVGGLLGGGWAVVLVAGAWESFSVAWGSPRLIEDDCAGPWRNASPFLLAFGGVQVPCVCVLCAWPQTCEAEGIRGPV